MDVNTINRVTRLNIFVWEALKENNTMNQHTSKYETEMERTAYGEEVILI